MERMHRLWIEGGGSHMSKQRLRIQVQILKKKVTAWCWDRRDSGEGRAEDDLEALNEESDEIDGEEQNRVDVAEFCVSVERCVDLSWRGKDIRLLKDEEKRYWKG